MGPALTHYNSSSNLTFIALNLPFTKGLLMLNQNSPPISVSRDRKGSDTMDNNPGSIRAKGYTLV